jgi:hypothetical protein
MKQAQARSRQFTAKQSSRLGAYLAVGVGASIAATASSDAEIITINIGPTGFNIAGPNAGLSLGTGTGVYDFPLTGAGALFLSNDSYNIYMGLLGLGGLSFAIDGGYASPTNFAQNDPVGSGANWNFNQPADMLFRIVPMEGEPSVSAPFEPGSYMGFRTAQGNYGWLEVTWNGTDEWEIHAGAYEDVAGVAILAGDTGGPAAVPEPGTWAAAALLAGGAAFARWRRRRDESLKEAA